MGGIWRRSEMSDAEQGVPQSSRKAPHPGSSRKKFDMMITRKLLGTKGKALHVGFYLTITGVEDVARELDRFSKDIGPLMKQFTIEYSEKLRAKVVHTVKASFSMQGTLPDDLRHKGTGKWKALNPDYASWKMGRQTTRRQRDRGEVSSKKLSHTRTAGTWRQRRRGKKSLEMKVGKSRTSKIWSREQARKVLSPSGRKGLAQEHAARRKMQRAGKKPKGGSGGPMGVLTGDMYKALTSPRSYGAKSKSDIVAFRGGSGRTWGMFWGLDARKIPHFLSFTKGRKVGKKRQPRRQITFYTKEIIVNWHLNLIARLNEIVGRRLKKGLATDKFSQAYNVAEVKQAIGSRQVQQKVSTEMKPVQEEITWNL